MSTYIFDTLQYVKKLRNAGFSDIQAEAQVEALADFAREQNESIATKFDIQDVL